MARDRIHFLFLNIGHFLDHLFTLIFATVAALALTREWGLSYAELVPYATPGFVAFGLFSLPAGWLSDRWSRYGMMSVFFIGIGIASIFTAFASTPFQIMLLLFFVGVLAAIYHPVGLAMVVESAKASGTGQAIAINGVWGNLGVGSAALITGFLIDNGGWRAAFILPGLVSIAIGIAYFIFSRPEMAAEQAAKAAKRATGNAGPAKPAAGSDSAGDQHLRQILLRLSIIIFCTAALSSIVFQSTTFALPKVLAERMGGIAGSATVVGWLAFVVFAVASMAQLVVGRLLDTLGPRTVFMGVAAMQVVFFLLMPGLHDWTGLAVALGFMLGAFGQIPINDYMIGRMARSEFRGAVYGARYVVSFVALAAALPLIAWVHGNWGFDALFRILAATAAVIFLFVSMIPQKLPVPDEVPAKA
ncbi:MAG TPA: MFS transporter [Hyphomicrobiaceae bacterium]|nr:MFS transporter [Hyphomicrobiaceae bacterium]